MPGIQNLLLPSLLHRPLAISGRSLERQLHGCCLAWSLASPSHLLPQFGRGIEQEWGATVAYHSVQNLMQSHIQDNSCRTVAHQAYILCRHHCIQSTKQTTHGKMSSIGTRVAIRYHSAPEIVGNNNSLLSRALWAEVIKKSIKRTVVLELQLYKLIVGYPEGCNSSRT